MGIIKPGVSGGGVIDNDYMNTTTKTQNIAPKLRKERRSEWKQSWLESSLNTDYDHSYYGASIFEGKNRNEKRANWRKSWEGFKVK